ncbi:FMN-dependent alpha-hydroxy acid dehydrogenase [Peniophora sp. CONT]|nr:FMN-dependent alpha-hydroxy acid dehydrogenase [Peniophora sp. CONT]
MAHAKDSKLEHPDHPSWSSYMRTVYATGERPSISSYDARKLAERAREVTKDNHAAFMYTFGSAGLSSTEAANRRALESWRLIPRMLRDASERDLNTTIFGVQYRCPVFVAPVGVQGILHKDGELATARAAEAVGVPFIMSTASTRTIEQVAEANGDGQRWYQLYWPVSNDITLSLLARVKKAGFTTLVITLDTMLLGWRPHDLDTAYLPFLAGVGTAVGTSDPVFMATQGMEAETNPSFAFPFDQDKHRALLQQGDEAALRATHLGAEWLKQINSGLFKSWSDVKFVRDHWDGPLVLKGIQSVADAHAAMDVGADGIVVSNHGGRQVDGAIPSFFALEQITADERVSRAQQAGEFTILFDSGIRTGTDIIKALAMGAQGVLVARPFMYALAISGQQGVEEVFRGLLADTEITLGLSGYKSIEEIQGKRDEVMIKWEASKM